jgi:hypothetical protein
MVLRSITFSDQLEIRMPGLASAPTLRPSAESNLATTKAHVIVRPADTKRPDTRKERASQLSTVQEKSSDEDIRPDELDVRFHCMCDEVRSWTLEISRNVRRIAARLLEMKGIHETITGTGWGKRRKGRDVRSFDEEVAHRTGLDRSLIRRYCRIAQLDPGTSRRIDAKPDVASNLTLLYRLVQTDEATRQKALDAHDKDGRRGLNEVLRTASSGGSRPGRDIERSKLTNGEPTPPEATMRPSPIPGPVGGESPRQTTSDEAGRTLTFECPPPGKWVQSKLNDSWTLRIRVVLGEKRTVSSVSVQIASCSLGPS